VGQLTGTDTIIGSATKGDFVALPVTVFGNPVSGNDGCSNFPMNPGGSCAVTVYFVPGSTGALTGSIAFPVTFTDGATTTLIANLSGNGVAVSNGPILTPGSATFGAEVVGVTDVNQQSVTFTNGGNTSLTVGTVSGSNFGAAKDFYFGSNGDTCSETPLNPGASCSTWVQFTPLAAGSRSGTLVFPVTYAGTSTVVKITATLLGTGITASQGISPSVTTLTFPATAVGVASSYLQLIFSNRGSNSYTINSFALSGANPGDFSDTSDGCTGTTLTANTSCSIYYNFTPGAAGTRTATLTETDTAPGSPRAITLTGTGASTGKIAFLPSTLAFGQGVVGVGSPETIVGVTNTGTLAANVTSVTSTVPADFVVVDDN